MIIHILTMFICLETAEMDEGHRGAGEDQRRVANVRSTGPSMSPAESAHQRRQRAQHRSSNDQQIQQQNIGEQLPACSIQQLLWITKAAGYSRTNLLLAIGTLQVILIIITHTHNRPPSIFRW